MKEGTISKAKAIPKFFHIELIKDNECVDSVNKSDDKEGNNNNGQTVSGIGGPNHLMPAKENSDNNGKGEADMSSSQNGHGAVPNNLRSWGFEKKKEDTQKDNKK